MYYNNFDKSSTNTNIELNIDRDEFLAQDEYQQNFHTYCFDSYNTCHTAFYSYFGNFQTPENFLDLTDESKINLNNAKKLIDLFDLDVDNNQDLDDILTDFMHIKITDLNDLNLLNQNQDLFNYCFTRVCGYSQGDISRIIYHKSIKINENYLVNLIYNLPIYGRLIVNDNEYYLEEYLNNCYDYDKNLIIENLKKENLSNQVIDFCDKYLPEYL